MSGITRFPTRPFVVAATILSFTVLTLALATSVSAAGASASFQRNGHLHVTKVCTPQTPPALSYCTITSSSLQAIEVGSKVVYLQAAGATSLDSDVVLVVGPGNYALGHVNLPFPAGPGLVTLSGGHGKFTRFHARVVVTRDFAIVRGWTWDGTYRFSPRD